MSAEQKELAGWVSFIVDDEEDNRFMVPKRINEDRRVRRDANKHSISFRKTS